ncbi:MAG: Secretion system C-terminal sorting domain [Bacteroidota bacterium]|jgi:Secretion system C-terminal sorting domain
MKRLKQTIILLCFIPTVAFAQPSVIYSIGAIGNLSGQTEAKCLSQSIIFSNGCVQLQTGLSLFSGLIGLAEFNLDCKPSTTPTPFNIRLYPNPVINYVRLEGSGFSTSETKIDLSIIDATGRLIQKQQIIAAALLNGSSYFWGWLQSGNYFLRIESDNVKRIIPFVKLN